MTRRSEISGTMAAALATAYEHGGELIRYVGGFWSWRGCPRHSHNGNPEEYFGTTTIEGLVARQRMAYTEWKEGRGGRFPIAVRVADGVSANPKDSNNGQQVFRRSERAECRVPATYPAAHVKRRCPEPCGVDRRHRRSNAR